VASLADRFRSRTPTALIVVCAACLLTPGTALAGTLDQQQTDVATSSTAIYSDTSLAQTFTAGFSGGLDQVDLGLNKPSGIVTAPLTVEIRDAPGGVPGSATLAGLTVPESQVPAAASFVSFNFASPAPVVAGNQYSIVAFSSTGGIPAVYGWMNSSATDPYAGGGAFGIPSSPPGAGAWTPFGSAKDLAFKTYVVPSPSTGQRAAALKKCKHKHSDKKRKKCRKRANLLPV